MESLAETRTGLELLEQHGDAMYRFAMARLRSAQAAEDAVQEALLAALSQLRSGKGTYAGRSSERTWLVGILRHKVIDSLRRSAREGPAPVDPCTPPWEEFFDERGRWRLAPRRWRGIEAEEPHALLERSEFRAILTHCLDALPVRLSRLFVMREADGVASEELCKVFGISATNFWTLLYRARTRLRECLDRSGMGDASPR